MTKNIEKNKFTIASVIARMALNLAHRAYVLEAGRCILEGRADALINDDRVKNAYLGG